MYQLIYQRSEKTVFQEDCVSLKSAIAWRNEQTYVINGCKCKYLHFGCCAFAMISDTILSLIGDLYKTVGGVNCQCNNL